jgi:erythromycin esterase-like protein
VLTNLRQQIKQFAKYAEECAREAETAPNAVRGHYRKLEKHYLILAQHYLLTLEEAERSYGWASHRTRDAQASSVPENPFDKAGC